MECTCHIICIYTRNEKQIDSRSADQLQTIRFFTNICLKYMEFDFKKIERQKNK